jgi:hypothetical protein
MADFDRNDMLFSSSGSLKPSAILSGDRLGEGTSRTAQKEVLALTAVCSK